MGRHRRHQAHPRMAGRQEPADHHQNQPKEHHTGLFELRGDSQAPAHPRRPHLQMRILRDDNGPRQELGPQHAQEGWLQPSDPRKRKTRQGRRARRAAFTRIQNPPALAVGRMSRFLAERVPDLDDDVEQRGQETRRPVRPSQPIVFDARVPDGRVPALTGD